MLQYSSAMLNSHQENIKLLEFYLACLIQNLKKYAKKMKGNGEELME